MLTLCDRSRTEEVMGAMEAASSSLLGTEFATWLMESWVGVMRSLRVSTLSRTEASALIVEERRGRIIDSPVERSLPSSELVGRGTTSLMPSLLSVFPRKFLTYIICSEGGEVELSLVEGTEEGGRGKPWGALGGPMNGHLCSSQRVLGVVQLTESARGGSSLRVQSIVRFCTRSNVVF